MSAAFSVCHKLSEKLEMSNNGTFLNIKSPVNKLFVKALRFKLVKRVLSINLRSPFNFELSNADTSTLVNCGNPEKSKEPEILVF